ncbi:MAG: hypothetical protein ONB48_05530 [candidate division KSB1 bacterium]|nr:hypothetical protein [candidate division KSB1 bacterium]MDZ7273008.1 hypothetical protein [candidate division KSB1 bacterium]MDZ7285111.1 hypothetical protein [candidate division KSB1 bacterium]MDZ7298143.1 hypothetical protein [candidate division KSB1 bacterium]MDZ7308808.1 hypothetical protein [candidate division KSB1 bacterium]
MKKRLIGVGMLAGCLLTLPAAAQDFWSWWGDGKAELSSYKIKAQRYGELREGYAVLIFVTEDLSRTTRIKVESEAIPPADRAPVLKLNHVVKFPTGIYDYSLLTSTFSSIESELGRPPFEPLKISFTAQEWCGQVFQMVIPQRDQIEFTLHSYFQGEGDQKRTLKLPANAAFEDNFLIWIRELKGEVLAAGRRREVQIFPSAWALRSGHREAAFQSGWIAKEAEESLKLAGGELSAWRWRWQVGNRSETCWVEKAHPHRILKWQSSDGGTGELIKTLRLPYWQLHDNDDLPYRAQLGIPQ